jgi:integrase
MTSRGDGRIFRRKETSLWWCAYYLRGREYRESTGETDEQKAERFLKRRLKEVGADQIGARAFIGPRQERVTVGQILDALERDYRLRDKWSFRVASGVKPVRNYFGNCRAIDVSAGSVSTYIQGLREQGYKSATINRWTQLLRQAFKIAIRDKHLSASPYIPRLSEVGNERQGFFETAHFEMVAAKLPVYLRDFARFGFLTGWRKSAIQTLRWLDVGEDVIYLQAKNSKTRKPETVPLEGELQAIIERRRAEAVLKSSGDVPRFVEHVFHRDGRRIGDFRKAWATACCAAKIGQMVCSKCDGDVSEQHTCESCVVTWKAEQLKYAGPLFHDLRRTAARNMVRAGVPPQIAMKITGHRTDAMFRRYAIVDEEQKREALAKTQAYLAAAGEAKMIVMKARSR